MAWDENTERTIRSIATKVAGCSLTPLCQSEFTSIRAESYFATVPSPDYIGPNYRGLLIVGGNPGMANSAVHHANDARMFSLQARIAQGDQHAFSELMSLIPDSMLYWRQMVDRDSRARLEYKIEDIAYINLVKCGTRPAQGDTASLFRGTQILSRCWHEHVRATLAFLNPTHIITLWVPIMKILEDLGFSFDGKVRGSHNGARNLPKDERYR